MDQFGWEARVNALVLEAADSLRQLAPHREGDKIKSRIARAAREAGLSYWRAFDLWYRKARRIDAAELEAIRVAAARRSREAKHDMATIARNFEALAEQIAALAAHGDRERADRWRDLARAARNLAQGD